MSKARAWPNNAKNARDRSAEEIQMSIMKLEKLIARVGKGEFTRVGLERDLYELLKHNMVAIRHLESVGAATRPLSLIHISEPTRL